MNRHLLVPTGTPASNRASGEAPSGWWLLLAAVLVALPLLGACTTSESGAADRPAGEKKGETVAEADDAVPVAAIPLRRGAIESVLRYSANLEAEDEVKVYSQAARLVTDLLVEEGQRVRKGQVLLRLEDDEQRSALEKVESQLAKALREFERQQRLFEQELISEVQFSDATYEKEQLEIAVEDARRELGYATVTAPISGVISQRLVSLGDYVQVNQHLFDLVDFGSIVARIYVPEKELSRLSIGQPARLTSQALGDETRAARIQRIAPTVDSQSGTVKVTLAIDDKRDLRPGLFVEVELVADVDDEALLVPKRALVYDEEQVYVYRIVEPGAAAEGDADASTDEPKPTVERVFVRPQMEDRLFVKVGDELAAGDRVVVAGQAGLRDGAEVRLLDLGEALSTFADELPSGTDAREMAEEMSTR